MSRSMLYLYLFASVSSLVAAISNFYYGKTFSGVVFLIICILLVLAILSRRRR